MDLNAYYNNPFLFTSIFFFLSYLANETIKYMYENKSENKSKITLYVLIISINIMLVIYL